MLRKEKRLYSRPLDGVAFERVAMDLLILGKHDPAALTGCGEPVNVGRVFREMVVVDFYAGTRVPQGLRDHALAKAAVNEKDN